MSARQRTALIAIGGNALLGPNAAASIGAERARVRDTCGALADAVAGGWRLVVTHGNGPQVGAALTRSERGAPDAYPLPLDVCVACTQGEIGLLLQQTLREALDARNIRQPVVTVVSQVEVNPDDPAFGRPSKPIGPFCSREERTTFERRGWTMLEEPPHGWRRVVPSPAPLAIVEQPVIRALLDHGIVVIALGGGGVPVVRRGATLTGIEAVVDKDLASALLATALGVDRLVFATNVDRVYLDFDTRDRRGLGEITPDELRRAAAAGHFPAGSMGPKVAAALRFVDAGGAEAIVASCDQLTLALEGRAGTRVLAAPGPDTDDALTSVSQEV